jgi:hypothetical protein
VQLIRQHLIKFLITKTPISNQKNFSIPRFIEIARNRLP